MNNLLEEASNNLISGIVKKKEEVVLDRLKEIGVVLDLEQEKKARFKSLVCEQSEESETWYYNDGTAKGLRLVTFVLSKPKFDIDEPLKVGIEYTYY